MNVTTKIEERIKKVYECGKTRNAVHLDYLTAGQIYDKYKKGFYTAIELSKIDENVTEKGKINILFVYFECLHYKDTKKFIRFRLNYLSKNSCVIKFRF